MANDERSSLTRSSFIFQRIMPFLFSQSSRTNLNCKILCSLIRIHSNLCNRGMRLMQDGAACQSSRTTMALLQANRVNVLSWPSRSPDLTPSSTFGV